MIKVKVIPFNLSYCGRYENAAWIEYELNEIIEKLCIESNNKIRISKVVTVTVNKQSFMILFYEVKEND